MPRTPLAPAPRTQLPQAILVVEDDPGMGSLLQRIVTDLGYRPILVTTGAHALTICEGGEPAVVLLDVYLPDTNGLEVARRLRGSQLHSAIVIVSVEDASESQVAGFLAGADDYVVKPFDIDVFKARLLCAVRHKRYPPVPSVLTVDGLTLDPNTKRVEWNGRQLNFTAIEFAVLRALMANAGCVTSTAELAAQVWGDSEMRNSNTYRVTVSRLRRTLESLGGAPSIVCVQAMDTR